MNLDVCEQILNMDVSSPVAVIRKVPKLNLTWC
jgi:hypothetical protein